MLIKIAFVVVGLYLLLIVAITLAQTGLLFPAGMATSHVQLQESARHLDFTTTDGTRLHGVYVPAAVETPPNASLLLGFGGNAWNAETLAAFLSAHVPDRDVVVFHYRGYRPSEGSPGAAALMEDGIAVHDYVMKTIVPDRVVAVGLSIGSGPAIYLARNRDLAGAILITPFDSLKALAREHYWWVPVGWLLRHQMEVATLAAKIDTPIAIIAAEQDKIVPSRRTEALRRSIRRLIFDRTIANTGHNDIYDHPELAAALREAIALIEAVAWEEGRRMSTDKPSAANSGNILQGPRSAPV
jgi:pimeloyl-ACP methyl ester carboxylesterase